MFKDLKEDDRYEISITGIVRNKKTKYIKSQYVGTTGYYMVSISKNNKSNAHRVHRLLANCFIPNPNLYKEVNHVDGNKLNNELSNLEWTDHLGNMRHAFSTGLINNTGVNNGMVKLNENSVLEIKKLLKQGLTQQKIASMFNVSRSAVLSIHLNRTWKYLNTQAL